MSGCDLISENAEEKDSAASKNKETGSSAHDAVPEERIPAAPSEKAGQFEAVQTEKEEHKSGTEERAKQPAPVDEIDPPFYKILGTAFHSYIFLELQDKVLIIDKHAAHERIIFEEMKKNMKRSDRFSQIVMIPAVVHMTGNECQALSDYKNEIKSIGIEFDINDREVKITAVPGGLTIEAALDMLVELAGKLSDGTANINVKHDMIFERALYQASCKAALKAGHEETDVNTVWLCDKLMRLPDIKYCPHGRPVAYELSKHEIERQFKRI
jgi:DNA mismatch repair protein MutL